MPSDEKTEIQSSMGSYVGAQEEAAKQEDSKSSCDTDERNADHPAKKSAVNLGNRNGLGVFYCSGLLPFGQESIGLNLLNQSFAKFDWVLSLCVQEKEQRDHRDRQHPQGGPKRGTKNPCCENSRCFSMAAVADSKTRAT
jgi:hypothetical protein